MPLPSNPSNNQTFTLNGVTYQYNSAKDTWRRVDAAYVVGGSGIASANLAITSDTFTGNGVQTQFVLSSTPSNIDNTLVNLNGVTQIRGNAYSLAGNTVTLAVAPAANDLVEITVTEITAGATVVGPVGFTGSQGTTGFTGSSGAGTPGYTGSAGAGFTGSAGVGFTGSAGVGFTGSAGTNGFTGSSGAAVVPKITAIAYPGNDTAADTAGGQTITLTGSGFAAGASVVINGALVGVVTVVDSTTITFVSPALATGSYIVYVVNTDGTTAIAVPGIQYSGTPAWSTAAGSLGSLYETQAFSSSVTATGDAAITYSLQSGSLPPGATFNANGTISGTSAATASPTTYTFTVRATDAQNQDTDRTFSITVNPDAVTWNSPTNGTVYNVPQNSIISNVSLSATSAAGYSVQYAANALPTGLTLSGNIISGTPTATGNTNTLLTATAVTSNRNATQTISWVVSVAADTFFPYVTTLLSASTPVGTFVTDASTNAFAVTVNGDTRPTNFGPYTPGYYSNYFDGTADNLTIPSNAALAFGTGAYTVEFWVYLTSYVNASNRIMDLGQANGSFGVQINNSNTIVITKYGSSDLTASSASFTLNTWNHIAVVRTSTSTNGTAYYLNGVNVGTITDNNDWTVVTTPRINGISGFSFDFAGYLSNLRIVKGTAVYTSNFTPSTTPLTAIANTSLLTCQSNRFIDNSTNNFTITRNGDTLISGFAPFVPSTSFAGRGSGFFDGSLDYLSIPNSAPLTLAGGDFTLEAWIYVTGIPDYGLIIGKRGSAGNSREYQMFLDTGTRALSMSDSAGSNYFSSQGIPLNVWSHVAMSVVGSSTNATARLFYNGTLVYTSSVFNNSTPRTENITIGSLSDGQNFQGYISNARIVKGTALYTTNFTPPATPLTAVAGTSLLTLQNSQSTNNNRFLDSSTNNFNITRNGNTTQGTFSPYGGGWSIYNSDTVDSGLTAAANSALDMGTGAFTIEAWVNTSRLPTTNAFQTSSGGYQSIFGTGPSSSSTGSQLYIGTTNLFFDIASDGSGPISVAHGMTAGQWYHVAITRSGNTFRAFVNGTLLQTATSSSSWVGGYAWGIMRPEPIGSYTGAWWFGYVSNFRVIKGTALYTSSFTPTTAPLTPVTGTSLLTCADNRFIDDSANNIAITRTSSAIVQRFNPFNPVLTTPTSYSAYFDGTGDWLSGIGTTSSFNFMHNTSALFTIEAWVYTGTTGAQQTIACTNGVAASASVGFWFAIETDNTLRLFVTNGSAGNPVINAVSSGTVPLNSWTHVAVTYNQSLASNNATFYINGNSSGTGTKTANAPVDSNAGNALNVGSYQGGGAYMVGYISNLRITNSIVYTGAFTPSTSPLTAIANTQLLTLQSATFTDNSTNNFTITSNGDTAPRQFNPFGWTTTTGGSASYTPALYGGSAYFDGTGDYLSLASNAAFGFGTGDFTIEFFVYPTVLSGTKQVLDMRGGSSNVSLIDFYLEGTTLRFLTNLTVRIDSNTALVLNSWTHCALVRSSGVTRMYVNGVQQTTTYTDSTNYATTSVVIGASNDGSFNNNYVGYLSDVRITKGTARYTSNFQPPVAPLAALPNTVLLTNMTGAGIYDSSMMGNYETVGTAQISTSVRPFGSGGSIAIINSHLDGCAIASGPQFAFGTGNWTVEGWFYTSQSGSTKQALVMNLNQPTGMSMSVSTSSIEFRSSGTTDISGSGVSSNTWTYIAWVRNGNTVTIYRNGTSIVSGTYTNSMGPSNFYVGPTGGQSGVANTFNYLGYIADLRITRGVARYTTNFTPTSSPFILN